MRVTRKNVQNIQNDICHNTVPPRFAKMRKNAQRSENVWKSLLPSRKKNARRLTHWEHPFLSRHLAHDATMCRGLATHTAVGKTIHGGKKGVGASVSSSATLLPDLAPAHYFLLARLKLRLKGRHFTDASENSTNREDGAWAAITLDAFSAAAVNTPPSPCFLRVITPLYQ